MKKVITISLAGRAYQVEEAGYAKLQAYLEQAAKDLANNPDKTDILTDIEQSIAEKCTAVLKPGENVISTASAKAAIAAVGSVETDKEPGDELSEQIEAAEPEPKGRSRKLYALPKEGTIAGVCAGLAAYCSVDVVLMRLLFAILVFVTQGAMIVVYLVLAIAMPDAKTPEQIAEAHGRPVTAQEIVNKVKGIAEERDLATRVGNAITLVARVFSKIAVFVTVASLIVLTGLLVAGIWIVLFGKLEMQGALAPIDAWKQIVFFVAGYVLLAVPLYWLFRVFDAVRQAQRPEQPIEIRAISVVTIALWTIAMFTVLTFVAMYTQNFREFSQRNEGYIKAGEFTLCLDKSKCANNYQYYDENGVLQGRDPSKYDPTITGEWR